MISYLFIALPSIGDIQGLKHITPLHNGKIIDVVLDIN